MKANGRERIHHMAVQAATESIMRRNGSEECLSSSSNFDYMALLSTVNLRSAVLLVIQDLHCRQQLILLYCNSWSDLTDTPPCKVNHT